MQVYFWHTSVNDLQQIKLNATEITKIGQSRSWLILSMASLIPRLGGGKESLVLPFAVALDFPGISGNSILSVFFR